MQQYTRVKVAHKDHVVFFRLGDFYEMFFEDAVKISKELGLTLTSRDCGQKERAPMCGVPYHASESYIARLIKKGYKVAICEQMEEPGPGKTLVSREVVRVVTPGTVLESNMLTEDANNFICCILLESSGCGLVFADVSTGEIEAIEFGDVGDSSIVGELARFTPREVVFNAKFMDRLEIAKYMREKLSCAADLLDDKDFNAQETEEAVLRHFKKSDLSELGLSEKPFAARALGALLKYLAATQKQGLERLATVNVREESRYMELDDKARANLEILYNLGTKERYGSLLWALDMTGSPMGKRLIKAWLTRPLLNPSDIEKRLNAVEELHSNEIKCYGLCDVLRGVADMERLLSRIIYGNAAPREYTTLRQSITRLSEAKELLSGVKSQYLAAVQNGLDPLKDVRELIEAAIMDEPAANLKEGGVIAPGYSAGLDELRSFTSNSREYLTELERRERDSTGIKNLKIGFNKVFGYYIEVTKSYLDLVPDSYIRRQTVANGERYIIQELKELEEKILTSHDAANALERQLFEEMRGKVAAEHFRIQKTATMAARLDVLCSFARVSLENRYIRPEINTGGAIVIKDGRHPVVERVLEDMPFVPNDTLLDSSENLVAIVTGPNMAGKSTYMRQTALIALMAQVGCFVPAQSAKIGIVDGIYTRIGASDDLVSGRSTFMVEMCEVAEILRSATSKSLLILDEIGRGTSTYDGMSIARAVIEYIADRKKLGAKTLFATHYHELTELENSFDCVRNYNTAVKKRGDDITFLRKIVRGGADDSYGIEVSKLAGIPAWVIARAHEVLKDLESAQPVREAKRRGKAEAVAGNPEQVSLLPATSEVEEELKTVDLNTLTPIEALTLLYKLKGLVR